VSCPEGGSGSGAGSGASVDDLELEKSGTVWFTKTVMVRRRVEARHDQNYNCSRTALGGLRHLRTSA